MILEKKLKNLNTEDLKKFIAKYGTTGGGHEVNSGVARGGEFTSPFESPSLRHLKAAPERAAFFCYGNTPLVIGYLTNVVTLIATVLLFMITLS